MFDTSFLLNTFQTLEVLGTGGRATPCWDPPLQCVLYARPSYWLD